ncbi:hypothetical protein [Pelagibaculum spongiae]|nr:hypothetical protein [Pelagibaculum spongiae]
MSEFAFSHLAKPMVFPPDWLPITIEENPYDAHSVCVIGRNAKSDLSRLRNDNQSISVIMPFK